MTNPIEQREIFDHQAPANATQMPRVFALGSRGPNGDNHAYYIENVDVENHPLYSQLVEFADNIDDTQGDGLIVTFQQGNPAEGWNGVTIEALLAIAYDRLNGCQAGPYACSENANAMCAISSALGYLHHRTWNREARDNPQNQPTD